MNVFINSERRLHAGWRVLLQFILFFVVLIAAQLVQSPAAQTSNPLGYMAGSLVYLAGMFLVITTVSRWVDRREITDFGLRVDQGWWQDMAAGMAIGAFTLVAFAVIELTLGWVEFSTVPQNPFNVAVLPAGLLALLNLTAVAFGEEITFRGYQIKNLAEGFCKGMGERVAIVVALVLTSALFGMAHLLNPNAGLLSTFNVALAGLLMGLGFVLTGRLALPLGFHIAWGFFEEFVFGYANSGQIPANSLLQSSVTGPDLWTGGLFGPEGGLLILLFLVLDILLVVLYGKRGDRNPRIHTELAVYRKGGTSPV